jgi:hypothetical protein
LLGPQCPWAAPSPWSRPVIQQRRAAGDVIVFDVIDDKPKFVRCSALVDASAYRNI